jgi:hypothetical protein
MTSNTAVLRPGTDLDHWVDDTVRRLSEEFRDDLQEWYVRRTVQQARADLSGVPADAVPELVERLARHRLSVP